MQFLTWYKTRGSGQVFKISLQKDVFHLGYTDNLLHGKLVERDGNSILIVTSQRIIYRNIGWYIVNINMIMHPQRVPTLT